MLIVVCSIPALFKSHIARSEYCFIFDFEFLPLVHCSASSNVLKRSSTDSENYNLLMCNAISQDIGGYDLSRHLNFRRKLTEVAIVIICKAYIADIKLDKMRMKS